MFLSAWNGAGFKGNDSIGYVVRVVPQDWSYEAGPDFEEVTSEALVALIASESAKIRSFAQIELLQRDDAGKARTALKSQIDDAKLSLDARAASLFTLAQLIENPMELLGYAEDDALREFALRAATDRLPALEGADLPLEPFVSALNDGTDRQQVAAAVALGRLGNVDAANTDLVSGQRAETNVPIQALYLLNSEFVKARAKELGILAMEASEKPGEEISWLYQTMLGRPPDPVESERALAFLTDLSGGSEDPEILAVACGELAHVIVASAEFFYLD